VAGYWPTPSFVTCCRNCALPGKGQEKQRSVTGVVRSVTFAVSMY
jgi:hypothetical protein